MGGGCVKTPCFPCWTTVVFPCGCPFRVFVFVMKALPGTPWYTRLSPIPDSSLRTSSAPASSTGLKIPIYSAICPHYGLRLMVSIPDT